MNNPYFETIFYLSPFHLLNSFKNYKFNDSIPYNKNCLSNNFSQLGYQIMNPQYISYQLEPIYSQYPTLGFPKSYSYSHIPKIEIGRPVETILNNNRHIITEKNNFNSEIHSILGDINHSHNISRNNTNNTTSTKDLTNYKDDIKNYSKYNNGKYSNNEIEEKRVPFIKPEKVLPFNRLTNDNNNQYRRKGKDSNGYMEVETSPNVRLYGIMNRQASFRNKIKRNWFGLFRHFVNIYTFFSSTKKYSSIYSKTKNNSINIRTRHVVNEVAILKDWIISMEESFFDEFRNYEDFNSKLTIKKQGDKNQILKKSILNMINLFIDNLESNLDDIPENVQSILFEYIKNKCYFPKKYLSKFQINRLDFSFCGSIKNLTISQCAMILSYLIINGICVQQILLHIKEVFTEYSDCENIEEAVKNIGSILHYLVRDIFKKKQKKTNDILALFNYYRSYHLFNEQIEKFKNKISNKIDAKINIEENDNEDEYIGLLLPYREIKEFFDENKKNFDAFKDALYKWSIELAKKIKNKYENNENDNDSIKLSRRKKRKIKSSLHG